MIDVGGRGYRVTPATAHDFVDAERNELSDAFTILKGGAGYLPVQFSKWIQRFPARGI